MIETSPERVFDVLADGWSYSSWVVGAAHIRSVDPDWPQVGSRIHHNVGPWPIQMKDFTAVRAVEPNRMLELDAEMRPFGAAVVRIELSPVSGGTEVRMIERMVRGPGSVFPDAAQGLILRPRNTESLSRLADIAVGRDQTMPSRDHG